MLKDLFKNIIEDWFEGIGRPPDGVKVSFVLKFRDLEIGRLRFEGGQWHFSYSEAFRSQHDFQHLTDFPYLDRDYSDEQLWPFFAQRIPSRQQPAVQRFMRKNQLEEIDEATLLKEFGRRTVANPFELEEAV